MASRAEANASFSVIAPSVIVIGCDSDDDAIVLEGCQRVLLSMHRKIEALGKCAATGTLARTRKLLALRRLQRNVGGGSVHWTIFATGWFEKRRDSRVFRYYFAFLLRIRDAGET
jgi:hypothetical protein